MNTTLNTTIRHRPLGKTQASILSALRRHGRWSAGCGWIWTGHRTTTKLLDSLVVRGLATKEERKYIHPLFKEERTCVEYRPVAA
jgi:hypothetical protein